MKVAIIGCILTLIITAVTARDSEWEDFKAKFGRKYKNPTEEAFRKKIFLDNKMLINQQNQRYAQGKSTFTMGVNQFADMTNLEFRNALSSNKLRQRNPAHDEEFVSGQDNPDSVDWRKSGCFPGVKDQGQCGTEAFIVTGNLQFVNCMATGKSVSLSEQNLIDCTVSYGNLGCNGGLMDNDYQYVLDNGGIDTEASYPYTQGKIGTCKYTVANKGGSISDYKYVTPSGSEDALETAVATIGPISAFLDTSQVSFQLYQSGIYDNPFCSSSNVDGSVLVAGYENSEAGSYWIVGNSWGTSWGERGYIRIAKDKGNQCGIADHAMYPIY